MPLDPTLHDRGTFSCGNERVDSYLKSTAAQAAKYFKSSTFVLLSTESGQRILGFYSLAQHGYRDGELDREVHMILLGQLGVASDLQGRGLENFLLKDALARSLSVAQEIGGVAIVTDPYDRDAQSFYANFGFEVLHEEPFIRMMLSTRTLARAVMQTRASAKSK